MNHYRRNRIFLIIGWALMAYFTGTSWLQRAMIFILFSVATLVLVYVRAKDA